MKVTVMHNVGDNPDRMWSGYQPGDPLVAVASYDTADAVDHQAAANHAYWLFNVGDEAGEPLALAYRQRRNRSLSVGDVVKVGDSWLAVARFGFDAIEPPADAVVARTVHGTTPVEVTA